MARVHLLDDELINKIAAGEVVERPASVVKELVENAIDAGATHVKVILKEGGRQRIQVQDDGSGMVSSDAILAVKRHTTSKLRAADDLFQVRTMGFRGEALASIASVSRFTLQTQTRAEAGCRVHIEDGRQQDSAWQGPVGTSITVADLFYNIPARRAFMKTAAAEFAACHEYMQALALSLPSVGFSLLHNDREIFAVSALPVDAGTFRGEQAMRSRATAILGAVDAEQLIYVQKIDRHAHVEALISAPGLDKSTARSCYTFVNGRWVRDKLLRFAIQRGYHSHLMKGKFPIALLYLTIDPALVDVNVHPAKAELRFQYGQDVQNAVAHAIREALRDGQWAAAHPSPKPVPPVPPVEMKDDEEASAPQDFDLMLPQKSWEPGPVAELEQKPKSEPLRDRPLVQAAKSSVSLPRTRPDFSESFKAAPRPLEDLTRTTVMRFDTPELRQGASVAPRPAPEQQSPLPAPLLSTQVKKPGSQVPAPDGQSTIPWNELQYIGPFARCFLLFEYRQQMLAIDQHAFHERILYERLLSDPEILRRTQPLLMPEVIAFSPTECERLVHMQDTLAAIGLGIQGVSETEIEVLSVPSLLVNKDLGSLLAAILGGKDSSKELAHDVLATMACHAAVRAGEELPPPELHALLREADGVDFYHNCPHGRRVFRWWKLAQVAAWFDR